MNKKQAHVKKRGSPIFTQPQLVVPTLVIMTPLFLYVIPLVLLGIDSLYRDNGIGGDVTFSGATNYQRVLFDTVCWSAAGATLVFAVTTVLLQVGGALVLALLTWRDINGARFVRAIIFAPYVLPTTLIVLVWRFCVDPFVGPIPIVAEKCGLNLIWNGPEMAMPAMITIEAFEALPFSYIALLFVLRRVPPGLYEVATIHGAGRWAAFVSVTWPQIKWVIALLLLLRMLMTWLKFDIPWLVFGVRGSAWASDTLAVISYRTAFLELDWGKAAALSVLLSLASILLYGMFAMTRATLAKRIYGVRA